jgi:zinc-ribbon domain
MEDEEGGNMYCPQCATPNADEARFCRSCGVELQGVAMVLRQRSALPEGFSGSWSEREAAEEGLEKYGEGVRGIATGITLLVVSVLIGVAMAFFVPAHIPWMLAWAVLIGWMTCWGGIELGHGIANMLASKRKLRLMGLAVDSTRQQIPSASEPQKFSDPSAPVGPFSPSSVTEVTTRQLDDKVEK